MIKEFLSLEGRNIKDVEKILENPKYWEYRKYIKIDSDGFISINKDGWKFFVEIDWRSIEYMPEDIWENFLFDENILYVEEKRDGTEITKLNREQLFYFITEKIFKNRYFSIVDTEDFYVYDEKSGIYKKITDAELKNIFYIILRKKSHKNIINETLEWIKYNKILKREELNIPKNKICLKNGIFNLKTYEIEEFNPEYHFFNQINVNYNPDAECKKIKEVLKLNLPDEKDRNALFELIGYCLLPDNPLQKFFIFEGSGQEGKSKIIELIIKFLGKENTTAIPFQDLSNDKNYCRSKLFGKMLCFFADIPSKELYDMSFIKSIVGEDTVTARSIYGKPFDFKFTGKMLYSANQLPQIPEDNTAIWRRIHMFLFRHKIPDDKKDPDIIDKITTPEELSGLFNEALKRLKILLERKEFSNSMTQEQIRELYLMKSDSVYNFILNCIEDADINNYVTKKQLYSSYISYCSETNKKTIGEKRFTERFLQLKDCNYERLTSGNNKGQYAFFGIKIKKYYNKSESSEESEGCLGKLQNLNVYKDFQKNTSLSSPTSLIPDKSDKNNTVIQDISKGNESVKKCYYCNNISTNSLKITRKEMLNEPKEVEKGKWKNYDEVEEKIPVCFDCLIKHLKNIYRNVGSNKLHGNELLKNGINNDTINELTKKGVITEVMPNQYMLIID